MGDEVPIVGKSLTKEILLEEDLIPKYFVELKDARVFLSDTYLIEGNRSGVVGYVIKDGKVTVNTFYKSNSQGIWRYLVGYKYDEQKVTQYNKGYAEESTTLPFEVQFALSKIPAKRFPFKEENNRILVSVGTAKK